MLWYPNAEIYKPDKMKTKGLYKFGNPIGAVIHTTAGNSKQTLHDALDFAIDQSICSYMVIDQDGKVGQSTPLNKWGNHAGPSLWPGYAGASVGVSQYFLGIELINAGRLTKRNGQFQSEFGEVIPDDQVRCVDRSMSYMVDGCYHKLTLKQEESLITLLCWLFYVFRLRSFKPDNIFGHDEVCNPFGRKTDPGGSLSQPMIEFRRTIKEQCK